MGGLVPPLLSRRTALAALLPPALALPLLLRRARVLLAPTEDGVRRVLTPLPSAADVALAVAGVALAFLLLRRDRSARPAWTPLLALLLAATPLVPLLSGRAPLLSAFQGPVMVMVAVAALAATLARAWPAGGGWTLPRPHGGLLLGVALGVFALLLTRLPGPAGAQGDEPHYLLMSHSLWTDGDVDLADDLRDGDYRPFYAGTLHAHASPASPPGQVLPVHAPGLSLLAAPAYAAGGERAVRLLMALLAAAAAAVTARLVHDVTRREGLAWAAWAVLVLTPPLPFYAVSIYPEVPAALATAVFLRAARGTPPAGALVPATLAAALLPWVHPKFLPLAAGGLLLVLLRPMGMARRLLPAVSALGAWAALLAYFDAVYGRASLSAAYGAGFRDDVSVLRAPWGALALLLDRQFGVLAVSPVWLLALPGAALLWRWRPGDALRAVLVGGLSLGVGASFSMWWGGSCPPARFVVPALPAFAVLAALAWARSPRAAAALGGLGAAVVALAMDAPRAIHNRADAESGLLRHLAPQLDLDGFLPSFVAATDAPLAAKLFTAALALAILSTALLAWSRRRRLAVLGGVATALLAASAHGRSPIVDARLATVRFLEAWDPDASWSPQRGRLADVVLPLDLGPVPWSLATGDVRVSRRLDLPPGTYRLRVDGEARGEAGARVLKIELVADDVLLEKIYVAAGAAPPEAQVVLPVGVRRLQLTAAGVQGDAIVRGAVLQPVVVVPGPMRSRLEWPRIGQPDRYRLGDGDVRVTALDRSEPRGDAFDARAGDRFAVDAPAGAAVAVDVEAGHVVPIRWAERDVQVTPGTRTVLAADGVALGRLVVVPLTVGADARIRITAAR